MRDSCIRSPSKRTHPAYLKAMHDFVRAVNNGKVRCLAAGGTTALAHAPHQHTMNLDEPRP
jgi:hypothetical protein